MVRIRARVRIQVFWDRLSFVITYHGCMHDPILTTL